MARKDRQDKRSREHLGVRLVRRAESPLAQPTGTHPRPKSVSQAFRLDSLVGLAVFTRQFVATIEGFDSGVYTLWRRGAYGGQQFKVEESQLVRYIREHQASIILVQNNEVYDASALYRHE